MQLELQTTHKLKLSQRMLLSTKILQMSAADLVDYLKEAAVENPVMELVGKKETETEEKGDALEEKLAFLSSLDEQNRAFHMAEEEDADNNDGWKFRSGATTFSEYLLEQAAAIKGSRSLVALVKYLIRDLDERGYLSEPEEEVARRLAVPIREVRQAIEVLQSFEPAGVGARSLQECLLLQLRQWPKEQELAGRIVLQYLDQVVKNQLHLIAHQEKVSLPEVRRAVDLIRRLNPKPANSFPSGEQCSYLMPDAMVQEENDRLQVVLNDRYFPDILVSPYYEALLRQGDEGVKTYLSAKIRQVNWIRECVEKRNETLLTTLEAIVHLQEDFFRWGGNVLHPMSLRDVAEQVNLHESTVSRAIRQKYLQCRFGLYPVSYFFRGQVKTRQGQAVTPEQVKSRIQALVAGEDKKKPLSDQKMMEMLEQEGITISRRTVAKYREEMGILSRSGRRE